MGCGMQFCRMLLFIFNFIFFICGAVLVGTGAYVIHGAPTAFTDDFTVAVGLATFLIVLGALIFFFAMFGCCGAWFENTCMLNTFALLLLLVLLVQFAAGIAAFVKRNAISENIETALQGTMDKYSPGGTDNSTKLWDEVQEYFKCCGVEGASDWEVNTALNSTSSVPDSCCKNKTDGCGANWESNKLAIFSAGCKTSVFNYIKPLLIAMGGVAIGLAFIEVVGIIMACCLSQAIKKQGPYNVS